MREAGVSGLRGEDKVTKAKRFGDAMLLTLKTEEGAVKPRT